MDRLFCVDHTALITHESSSPTAQLNCVRTRPNLRQIAVTRLASGHLVRNLLRLLAADTRLTYSYICSSAANLEILLLLYAAP